MAPDPRQQTQPPAPIEIDVSDLKKRKFVISGASLLALAVGGIFAHRWLAEHMNVHFLTEAEAQTRSAARDAQLATIAESAQTAAEAAKRLADSLDSHIKGEELKSARAKLDTLRGQLSETQLWETTNAPNEISRARKADLARQIDAVSSFISCLEAQRSGCQQ